MLKILICLICTVATAALLLELREQRLNLTYQTNKLHNQIEATQAKLWNQQLNIAMSTAPNAIAANAKSQNLKLSVPNAPSARPTWTTSADAAE
jgi:cell division protein FtsL